MENASKALLMAGGALISILIISVGISLYVAYSAQADEYSQILLETEISKYNSKFEVYVGRTDIKAQEVASAINLANEDKYNVNIIIIEESGAKVTYKTSEEFIKNFLSSKFSCLGDDAKYDNETRKITEIKFREQEVS